MQSKSLDMHRSVLIWIIGIAIAIRVAAMLWYGPLYQPDSHHFIGAADIIVSGSDWIDTGTLDKNLRSKTSFRILGYPMLIVAVRELSGDAFPYVITGLQSIVSVFATALVYLVAGAIGLGVWAAAFAALAYTASILFLFDFNILVDSFFANGLFISAALLALFSLRGRVPRGVTLLGVGAVLLCAMLVRETAVYFAPFWAIGGAIWAFLAGAGWRRAAVCYGLVILPTLVAAVAYKEWNRYREGEAFLTTGAQMTMWFAPLDVVREVGVDKFTDDPLLAAALSAAVQTNPEVPMQGAKAVNRYLFDHGNLRAPEIASLAFRAYFRALRLAPLTLLKGRFERFRPRSALLLFDTMQPIEVMGDLSKGQDSVAFLEQIRQVRSGEKGIGLGVWLLTEVVQLGLSAVLLLAFVAGVPVALMLGWRRHSITPPLIILGWFWLLYGAVNGAYLLASYEGRYVIGTLPFACIGGLWVLTQISYAFRSPRKTEYSRM